MNLLIKTNHRARRGPYMDTIRLITSVVFAVILVVTPARVFATQDDGLALAIVYDTSGSMKEQVRDRNGKLTPKYVIANRALEAISNRIQTFATNATTGGPRTIHAGLFVFEGTGAKQAVKFVAFDVDAKVFDGVKKLGATVVGASDEAQLDSQLEFILQKKILLEDEEPTTKKP